MVNIRTSLMLAALTLARMLTALGVMKAIAVTHGAVGVGLLGHLQGVTGLIAGFLAAPLGNGLIRAVASAVGSGAPDRGLRYWREALRISTLIAAAGLAFVALFHAPLLLMLSQDGLSIVLLLIALVAAPFQALTTAFQSLLNGLGKLRELSLLGMVSTLATLAISLIGVWSGGLSQGLATALLAVTAQTAVFAFYFRSTPWLARGVWVRDDGTADIRRDIRVFAATAVATAMLIPGAQVFIRSFMAEQSGWAAVGYWQAAQRLSDAHLSLLGTILSTQLLPRLVRTEQARVGSSVVTGTVLSGLLLVPGALVLMLFGENIVRLVFSDALQPATQVLGYHVTADLLRALSWPASYFLIARAQLRSFCLAETIFAMVWVLGTIVLSSGYGWVAASMAYLAASASTLIFLVLCVARQIRGA